MQDFLDGPERFDIVARFDQRDAAGIEPEHIEAVAVKPAGGKESWRRRDDEEGLGAGRDGGHEGDEEAQRRRLVFRRGGMDLMHAFERQALPGQMPVERQLEGEARAFQRFRGRRGEKLAQIIQAGRSLGLPLSRMR